MLWLTLRLGDFYRTHPHMALRIVGEFVRVDRAHMTRDGIAAAVRFGPAEGEDPQTVDLFDEWLVPVATPAFRQAHPQLRCVHDLRGKHLLHAADPWEEGTPTEGWAQWLAQTGVELPASDLRQGTQFNLSQLAVQAALGGQGIAMGRVALVLAICCKGGWRLRSTSAFVRAARTGSSAVLRIRRRPPSSTGLWTWVRPPPANHSCPHRPCA